MNKQNKTPLYNPTSEPNTSPSKNYLYSSSQAKNISTNLIQNDNIENLNENINKNIIKDTYRPTYVSYLSKTLPRGPYLQYKYKDQENAIKNLIPNDNNSDNKIKPHCNLLHQQHLPSNIEHNYIKNSHNTINKHKIPEIYRQHETDHKNHLMTSSSKDYGNYQNIDINNYGITLPYRKTVMNIQSGQLLNHKPDHHVQPKNIFNVKQLSDYEIYKNHINPIRNTHENNKDQYNNCQQNQQKFNKIYQNDIYNYRNEYLHSQQNLPHINGCQTLPFNLKKSSLGSQFRTEIEQHQNNNNKQTYKSISQYQNKMADTSIDASNNNNKIFNKNEPEIKINHLEHLNINNNQYGEKENIYLTLGNGTNRNSNVFTHISNNFGSLDINHQNTKYKNTQKKSLLTSQVHYVTLADVCLMKSEGLNEIEGWAILCQSVQALQDLFLSDTPSITKVLPLVRSSTVQITTRGRIVFNLTSINEFHCPSDTLKASGAASYFDITAHISPEYLNSMGKKIVFLESDVEKMWIYSLGVTLRKTLKSQRFGNSKTTNTEPLQNQHQLNKASMQCNYQQVNGRLNTNNLQRNKTNNYLLSIYGIQTENGYLEVKPTLDEVIDCMCENNFYERCSLMFLLDLNPERTTLRRTPLSIHSLNPTFNERQFNFKQINNNEKILDIDFENHLITIIINKSPLTNYHSLMCPKLMDSLPQKLNVDSIRFSIRFLGCMNDKSFRIGYNSPGAHASVNHLHLHLLHIERDLMIDNVVISKYFRNQNQIKPFSHIVMDIVKDVAIYLKRNIREKEISRPSHNNKNEVSQKNHTLNKLKIIPDRSVKAYGYDKYSTIGNIRARDPQDQVKNSKSHQLIVRRRTGKQNDIRRNTIEVNVTDLKRASEAIQYTQLKLGKQINISKSTNYIDILTNNENERFEDKLDKMNLCDISFSEFNFNNSEINSKSKISTSRQNSNLKPLTKAYSEESFLTTTKGPEFITKSTLSSRELDLYQNNVTNNNNNQQIVHILLLNGQSRYITCNSISTTTQEIFQAIIKSENYIENFFLGLCVLIGGDFVFLPNNFKIYKVAPQNWIHTYKKATNHHCNIYFTLFLRIKFFLPTLRGVSSLESRHMLYLQLRKNILEKHILCNDDDLIILGGLALQAEIGDFKENLKYTEYFTLSHYLPENVYSRNKEMAKYLRNSHYCRRGLHKREAEQIFIKYIQGMKEYGYHLYSAIWMTDDNININIYVGISLGGIALFERDCEQHKLSQNILYNNNNNNNLQNSKITYQKKLYINFEWLEIENLCFSKHILCIVVRKPESLKSKNNNRVKYKLRMDDKKSFFAFNLASEHHQFYMRLKNSFISLKSISDELNIPITLTQNLKYQTTNCKQSFPKELPMCMLNDNNNNDNKNPNTNSTEIVISENLIGIDKQSNTYNGGKIGGTGTIASRNMNCDVEIIACTIDSTVPAIRAKNIKKSMLNENRLLKFKEKYLRRTKSTAGCEVNSISVIEKIRDKNLTKVKSFKKLIENALSSKECDTNSNRNKITKEEYQNKENECPKNNFEPTIQLSQISSQLNSSNLIRTESDTSEEQLKVYSSPNRNRVKMGTRVFSSKILNKSFDNIYEGFTKSQQFDSVSSLDVRGDIITTGAIESADTSEDGGVYASIDYSCDFYRNRLTVLEKQFNYEDNNENENVIHSLQKDNLGSNYSVMDITPSHNGEAYVIHSSIRSDRPCQYNSFTLQNDTMSDSLIEKFNNISHNSSAINERKLTKIKVVKERIKIPPSSYGSRRKNYIINDNEVYNQQEIVNRGNIKYATINLGTVGRHMIEKSAKNIIETFNKNDNKETKQSIKSYTTDDLDLTVEKNLPAPLPIFAKSQDSIFIDNKLTTLTDNLAITQNISKEKIFSGLTLGVSIIQGTSDNHVYVKDLIPNGPGEKAGIQIGDQIIAVNGISLLNLSYNESLRLLQNTGRIVELIVSQILYSTKLKYKNNFVNENIFKTNTIITNNINKDIYLDENVNLSSNSTVITSLPLHKPHKNHNKEIYKNQINCQNIDKIYHHKNIMKNENYERNDSTLSVNKQKNIDDTINPVKKNEWKISGYSVDIKNKLVSDSTISTRKNLLIEPKEIAIIHKSNEEITNETVEYASVLKKSQRQTGYGQSRKYLGPVRYPVTPMKGNTSIINENKKNLSLLPDDDEQVVI